MAARTPWHTPKPVKQPWRPVAAIMIADDDLRRVTEWRMKNATGQTRVSEVSDRSDVFVIRFDTKADVESFRKDFGDDDKINRDREG